MGSPFENPADLANKPKGVKWPNAALLAIGVGLVGWYVFLKDRRARGDSEKKDPLHPPPGDTTQQMYADRYSQQHRTPPPSQQIPTDLFTKPRHDAEQQQQQQQQQQQSSADR